MEIDGGLKGSMVKITKRAKQRLIKRKSNVNAKKLVFDAVHKKDVSLKEKQEILWATSECDREDILEELLQDTQIDINLTDENGHSAIFHAVINGSTDCFNTLLSKNADVQLSDTTGRNVLTHAVENNHHSIVSKVLKVVTPNFISSKTILEVDFVKFTEIHYSYGHGEFCCESYDYDECKDGGHCCKDICQHYFKFCVQPITNDVSDESCVTTGVLTPNETYTMLKDRVNTPNPWQIVLEKPIEQFNFNLEVYDKNVLSSYLLYESRSLIDIDTTTVARTSSKWIERSYNKTNRGEYLFHFRSYCAPNYYNQTCDVYCKAQRESSGSYRCHNETGAIICLDGWSGKNCDKGMSVPELSTQSITFNQTDFESGTAITLKCTSVSNPSPSYHWFKDGTPVAISNTTLSFFVLTNSTVDDSGSYTCESRNGLANMTSNSIDLHIWEIHKPTITSSKTLLNNSFINYQSNVTLTCSNNGNAPGSVQYQWIDLGNNNDVISNQSTLTISADERDSVFEFGCQTTQKHILLNSDPLKFKVTWLDEPQLSISQSAYNFKITCSSLGYPKPTYHWYINNTKVIETNSSSLWLPNAVLKDGHNGIKCASQNPFGLKMVAREEILSYKDESAAKKPCTNTSALGTNTRIVNRAKSYQDGDVIMFECDQGYYFENKSSQAMVARCVDGEFILDGSIKNECLKDYCKLSPCKYEGQICISSRFGGARCICEQTWEYDNMSGKCFLPRVKTLEDDVQTFEISTIVLAVVVLLLILLVLVLMCCFKRKRNADAQRNYARHTDDNVQTTPNNFQNNAFTFEGNEMKERKEEGSPRSPPPDYASA
ncbi:uncharacterized protein [Clytia hemisphaerica]|uniref:Delta-like protein n=1 Tax=Clytia hemisphaerica TaxID=252671 RepID=A0A7M5WVT0_9CNID